MKLLLLVIRGLQAGAIGPHGNRWIETDSLDALASQGVVFDQHFVVHPDPGSARRAWRTGRYDFQGAPPTDSSSSVPVDLLAVLRERGVSTRLILDVSRPLPEDWLRGWGEVETARDTESAVGAGRKALARLKDEPSWMLCLDLAALLPPWNPPQAIVEAYFSQPSVGEDEEADEEDEEEDYEEEEEGVPAEEVDEDLIPEEEPLEPFLSPTPGPIDPEDDELFLRLQTSYATAISHVDALLGTLLDGLPDDVHVVLTADQGQCLGEHGMVGAERPCVHEEVVHVPLLIAGPGCRAGRHVAALTASIDLGPTLAELAGAPLEEAHGRSLLRLLAGEDQRLHDLVGLEARVGETLNWGVRTPGWAYLLTLNDGQPVPSLFVKPGDRYEVNDVVKHHQDRLEGLENALRALVEASRQPGPLREPELSD